MKNINFLLLVFVFAVGIVGGWAFTYEAKTCNGLHVKDINTNEKKEATITFTDGSILKVYPANEYHSAGTTFKNNVKNNGTGTIEINQHNNGSMVISEDGDVNAAEIDMIDSGIVIIKQSNTGKVKWQTNNVEIKTTGKNSPAIYSENGNVTIKKE